MKKLVLLFLKIYRHVPRNPSCRFQPSCSAYTFEAVGRFGIIKGGVLSLKRILRCHPWSKGGFDAVP